MLIRNTLVNLSLAALYLGSTSVIAAEFPMADAPRFIDQVVHSPNYFTMRSKQIETFGASRNVPDLSSGSFLVFDQNQNATLVKANGQVSTVKCDLLGQSFLWKNDVTTLDKSFWDEKNEILVKSLRLNFQWHSDAHLVIDFKKGTCTDFEPFDGDSFFSFQTDGASPKFIYYRDYAYQKNGLGSQLIGYDPATQTKTLLADCKDIHAGGICADFRAHFSNLEYPKVVGVIGNNQAVLQTPKQLLLLDSSENSVRLTTLYTVKKGDTSKIRDGSVVSNGLVYFLTAKDTSLGSPTDKDIFSAFGVSADTAKVQPFFQGEANGAALSSDGRYLLTWSGLKIIADSDLANFETVQRVELLTGNKVNLPSMGAYKIYTNPTQYSDTLSFWMGDIVAYRMADRTSNRQWVKISSDGSLQSWNNGGHIAGEALTRDYKSVLGVAYSPSDKASHLQVANIFSSSTPQELAVVPSFYRCDTWNCGDSGMFYYWPEANSVLYYDSTAKKLKIMPQL